MNGSDSRERAGVVVAVGDLLSTYPQLSGTEGVASRRSPVRDRYCYQRLCRLPGTALIVTVSGMRLCAG